MRAAITPTMIKIILIFLDIVPVLTNTNIPYIKSNNPLRMCCTKQPVRELQNGNQTFILKFSLIVYVYKKNFIFYMTIVM